MTDRVRIGVIGTGWWDELVFLPILHNYSRSNLAAICGRNRARADEMAQKYGIPQVFTDYHEMIEKGGLDAVVVAAPDDLHYPMVMDALDAGLHVLCEKPLALNVAHARAMYEKAEAAGVKHMTFYTWRWTPLQRTIKELVDEGYIGRCYDVHLAFRGGWGRSGEYSWRSNRQRSNGAWGDLGSHMIDQARWLIGEIEGVSAHLTTHIQRPGEDGGVLADPSNDSAVATVRFQNGAHGTLQVSYMDHIGSRFFEQQFILHGEAGALEGHFSGLGSTLHGARADEEEIKPLPIPDRLWGDSRHPDNLTDFLQKHAVGARLFVDAILDNTPLSPTFYDGMKAQAVIDAGIASHELRRWVTVGSHTDF